MADGRKLSKPPDYIADFDSASAMVRATAAYLHGRDFPALGMMPRAVVPAAKAYGALINRVPERLREQVYTWSGRLEAFPARRAGEVDVERLAQWAVAEYPRAPRAPAIMLGSSNGALVHMCCALQIPWLPQTMLVPIRRRYVHPDDPEDDIRVSMKPARELLEANPDVVLHHMHDPNQDRLMVQRMTYFRVKKTQLGPAYERFIQDKLERGGTIYLVECRLRWPTTAIQERHYFQFGALGGASAEEFHHGSDRVAQYLKRYGSHRVRWQPPEPDALRPEAEWGYDRRLSEDVERFARQHGFHVQRIVFDSPEDTSALVADFYRQWNRERGITGNRLLVESFVLMDPFLVVRTGSVPYWMVFNKKPSADNLERFLDEREPFDEIYMTLFSHGVDSVGLVPIERWRELLARARVRGSFAGVDTAAYPRDFAVMGRYRDAIAEAASARYAMPPRVDRGRFESFVNKGQFRYRVRLSDAIYGRRAQAG